LSKTSQFFVWVFSDGISIQANFSPICYCVSNILLTDNYQILPLVGYSVFPMSLLSSLSIPNLSKNEIKGPILFHKVFETNINCISFITFERVGTMCFLIRSRLKWDIVWISHEFLVWLRTDHVSYQSLSFIT